MDSLFSQHITEIRGYLTILFVQNSWSMFKYRYIDTEAMKHLSKLYSDRSTTNDCQAVRQCRKCYRLNIRDKACILQSLRRWYNGFTSSCDNDLFGKDGL